MQYLTLERLIEFLKIISNSGIPILNRSATKKQDPPKSHAPVPCAGSTVQLAIWPASRQATSAGGGEKDSARQPGTVSISYPLCCLKG